MLTWDIWKTFLIICFICKLKTLFLTDFHETSSKYHQIYLMSQRRVSGSLELIHLHFLYDQIMEIGLIFTQPFKLILLLWVFGKDIRVCDVIYFLYHRNRWKQMNSDFKSSVKYFIEFYSSNKSYLFYSIASLWLILLLFLLWHTIIHNHFITLYRLFIGILTSKTT